jgi:hypothetical protein
MNNQTDGNSKNAVSALIARIKASNLDPTDAMVLLKVLAMDRDLNRALNTELYLLEGYGRHLGPGGAFDKAAKESNCSIATARRAHKAIFG